MTTTAGRRTDRQIQQDVSEELLWEPRLPSTGVGVTVQDGVVTLTGQVGSYAERWAAERSAQRVRGVRAVADELEVRLGVDAERTDAEVALAAVRALEWDSFVPAERLDVTVAGGWVMLRGQVEFGFQRRAAERELRRLRGVRGITNLVRVRPRGASTGQELRRRIQGTLLRRVGTAGVTVEVAGDAVLLAGTVQTLTDRDEAERVAWSTPGVCVVRTEVAVAG
ncbi:BON domain-containing protein [Micromonospora sagamiensis]|uniref:Osmotically-inducible protein Y n=1 Tax=Micromonospora sagamiensis TaxID=47875 RepID=A0A562WBP9_9ACTN|nr:BON domain-containing protein [Micromonospora sagamiensis]TWJ27377.1 osmotically-inducible protein OsmY [Micromonospora sagamiensis]BCL13732.1 BON domain-containing protein [Micromonospora sagamiensis]